MDAQEAARRKQRQAEQAQQKADKLTAEAKQRAERAFGMYGRFAGGQPLLSGRHSYRSARRAKNRADAASDRAIDAYKAAERAKQNAASLKAKADARTEIADVLATRSRPWEPADFRPGDIVTVRVFETSTDTYRVKRVNKKTLTLDGGGGGWDDPKREYDRILSRTRDGITTTNPEQENETPMTNATIPAQFSEYDWMELLGFAWKVQNEGYEYAAENYSPRFESDALKQLAEDDDPRPLKKLFKDNEQALEEWQEATDWQEVGRLMDAHQQEEKERKEADLPWGLHPGGAWDFAPYSQAFATREEALKAIAEQNALADKYEHFVPFTGRLLHREVPRGEWTEVPLTS